jgi:hypothetical protein
MTLSKTGLSESEVSCLMSEKRSTTVLSKMNVRPKKIMTALLGLLAVSGIDGRAQTDAGGVAPGIKAAQEDEKTIRVIVPGHFETTFTKKKGFGGVWFDLKHDPQKKHDLAPVREENGLLWIKNGPSGADGSWYAGFKIKDWPDTAPETLTLGGEKLAAGKDFNASVRGGVLLLQIFRGIKDGVSVAIPGP